MGQVDGKVCIVTGGAGSIGLAAVRLLLQEGAKVALVDIDDGKLERAAAGLDPNQVITIAADVAKTDQVKAYVARAVATWGKIDVLFSNAGNDGPIVPTIEYPEEIFDSIIATHVRGCFLGCKYVIPQMNDGFFFVIRPTTRSTNGLATTLFYSDLEHA